MSNASSGASYDAILVDHITAPAQQIIHTLAQMDAAFRNIQSSSGAFAQNMQVIAAAMRGASRGPTEDSLRFGMVLNRVSEVSSQLGSSIGRAIEGVGRVMQATGAAAMAMSAVIVAGLTNVIKAASDATETLNAFKVVIEIDTNRGKELSKWAEDFASLLGRSSQQTKRAITTYQSLWKGLGATGAEANQLSKAMVQLQTDFGSFFNVSDDESLRRFIAALSGSSEVLDQFGINIRENALEAKASEMGFGDNVRKMTEYQKALVRAAILSDVLGKRIGALGDAARTQFEFANMLRSAEAAALDLRIGLGQLIITELKEYLFSITNTLADFAKRVKEIDGSQIRQFLGGVVTLAAAGAGLLVTGTAIAAVGSAATIAAIAMAGLLTAIGAIVAGGAVAAITAGVAALAAGFLALGSALAAFNFDFVGTFKAIREHAREAIDSVLVGLDAMRKALGQRHPDYEKAWEAFKLTANIVFLEIAQMFIEIMGRAVRALGDTFAQLALGNYAQAIAGLGAGVAMLTNMGKQAEALKEKLADLANSMPDPKFWSRENKLGVQQAVINVTGIDAVAASQQIWKQMTDAANAVKDGFAAAVKHTQDLKKEASDWADSMLSPAEKFVAELQKIRVMESFNAQLGGRITPDMIKRAQMQAAEKFLKDTKIDTKFQATSVGTFNRAVARNMGSFGPAFDPMVDEQKKTNEKLDAINKGVAALNRGDKTF